MKILLPPELVLGTSLLLAFASALPAQTSSPSPSASTATFGPPTTGPAPSRAPEPVRSAPSWAVPPNPAPQITPPAGPLPYAPFVSGGPDLLRLERATPRVLVWRSGSDTPQRPERQSRGRHQAFVAGTAPVTIVLRFHPLAAHKSLAILPSRGVTTNPVGFVPIAASGEIAIAVQLQETQSQGHIVFRLDSVNTIVRVTRAPSQAVAAAEQASIGMP